VKKVAACLVFLFLLTPVLILTGADLKAQALLFDSGSWLLGGHPVVTALYKYGTYPAVLLAAAAIIIFGAGFMNSGLRQYRKAALALMLVIGLGPGLVINVILKNYTGRPRPREVEEFGGKWQFKNVFEFGKPGMGHSFPCGHCSMGFYFAALYVLLRRKRRKTAYAFLGGSVLFGSAMGFARMAQGGHFLSDVIWAGGITYITAEAVYALLGGDKKDVTEGFEIKSKVVPVAVMGACMAGLAAFFLMSTPYYTERNHELRPQGPGRAGFTADVTGNIAFRAGAEKGLIEMRAQGFGMPRRSFTDLLEKDGAGGYKYSTAKKGFFAELGSDISIQTAGKTVSVLELVTSKGGIEADMDDVIPVVKAYTAAGSIRVRAGPGVYDRIELAASKGDVELVLDEGFQAAKNARISITAENGRVVVVNKSGLFKDFEREREKLKGAKEIHYMGREKESPAISIKAGEIVIR